VISYRGFYVVAYALGIYLLNVLLLFLSPRLDPEYDVFSPDLNAFSEAYLDAPPILPVRGDDEFRPFVRKLPEFLAWLSATRALLIALVCSMIPVFDIPVFWPILVLYFVVLFVVTMRRQIAHMIKYRYVPFDFGKKQFGKSTTNNTV
jgi:hypothetical protein